jgi:hypothetical protein
MRCSKAVSPSIKMLQFLAVPTHLGCPPRAAAMHTGNRCSYAPTPCFGWIQLLSPLSLNGVGELLLFSISVVSDVVSIHSYGF